MENLDRVRRYAGAVPLPAGAVIAEGSRAAGGGAGGERPLQGGRAREESGGFHAGLKAVAFTFRSVS